MRAPPFGREPTRCPRPPPLRPLGAPPQPAPATPSPWLGAARADLAGRTGRPRRDGALASSVQPRLLDVALDALGHEVPDRAALPDPFADVRGGDGQGRDVHDAHVWMAAGLLRLEPCQVVAGPGGRDEVRELEDLVGVLPLEDLQHGVGTRHEERSTFPPRCSFSSRRVSTVYVGPSRSTSSRDTKNRGLLAVAITVMRYRCSGEDTSRSSFIHGCPVGTNTTSSRPN